MTSTSSPAAVPDGVRGPGVRFLSTVAILCGAGLMGLEIAGARLLEPYLGNTIYVWGSIIGVFMVALSLGYFVGGRVADRNPRLDKLGGLILLAGLCCFVVPVLSTPLCRWITDSRNVTMDVRYRALLVSMVLFLIPSALLGMVSPYVLRLSARHLAKVGQLAGALYAASSVGSIAGTFLTSFYLPEAIGSKVTVWCVGVLLGLVGVTCVVLGRMDLSVDAKEGASARRPSMAAAGIALGLLAAGAAGSASAAWEPVMPVGMVTYYAKYGVPDDPAAPPPGADVLEVVESAYHHITIIEGDNTLTPRGQTPTPALFMMFNNQTESGIVTERPGVTDNGNVPTRSDRRVGVVEQAKPVSPAMTACGYVHMLHLGMVATNRIPKRVLVIGCGGGVGPLMMRDHFKGQVEQIDVVDIDAKVFELAEKYFGFPYTADDPVIRSHVDDGRLFMQNRPDERWDYIIMDAYTSGGRIPKHLITREFFDLARSRLTPDGLVLGNIISGVEPMVGQAIARDPSRLFRSVYKTMAESFERGKGGQLLVFPRANRGTAAENIIMVAFPPERETLDAALIRRRWQAQRGGTMRHLPLDVYVERLRLTPPDTNDVPLLTDDFCPTDAMTAY